ncbi:MAG: GAF and ANTAR domain-containing protein [Acidimicrobiales bacterium]
MPADDGDGLLSALRRELTSGDASLEAICRGSVTLLDVSGAAVILMSEAESGSLTAAFGARVAEVEDLQFALGEGPCLDAYWTGAPIIEPDLLDGPAERWPEFAREALAVGARAVFVLPLHLGAIRLGVLYLYRDRPGMLSAGQLADGLDVAAMVTLAILELQTHAAPGSLGPGLAGEWAHRAAVHQATGMVAAHIETNLADALGRIRAHAFAHDQSIYDLAAEIVSGHRRLEP